MVSYLHEVVLVSPPQTRSPDQDAVPSSNARKGVVETGQATTGEQGAAETSLNPSRFPLGELIRGLGGRVFHSDSVEQCKQKTVATLGACAKKAEAAIRVFVERRRLATSWRNGNRSAPLDHLGAVFFATIVFVPFGVIGFLVMSMVGVSIFEKFIGWLGLLSGLMVFNEREWRDVLTVVRWRFKPSGEEKKLRELNEWGRKVPHLSWTTDSLERFRLGSVPESVLALIRKLREQRGDLEFDVHYTEVAGIPSVSKERLVDSKTMEKWSNPFLQVRLKEESYFIAAWNEDGLLTALTS